MTFPKAAYLNASMMVSAYGGDGAPFCQVANWLASSNGTFTFTHVTSDSSGPC